MSGYGALNAPGHLVILKHTTRRQCISFNKRSRCRYMSDSDPGVVSLILARSHTFVGINHEIVSMVIPLPSADSRRVCQLQAKVCARSTG